MTKTHMLSSNKALCNALPGYYSTLMLLSDWASVTCQRCLKMRTSERGKAAAIKKSLNT